MNAQEPLKDTSPQDVPARNTAHEPPPADVEPSEVSASCVEKEVQLLRKLYDGLEARIQAIETNLSKQLGSSYVQKDAQLSESTQPNSPDAEVAAGAQNCTEPDVDWIHETFRVAADKIAEKFKMLLSEKQEVEAVFDQYKMEATDAERVIMRWSDGASHLPSEVQAIVAKLDRHWQWSRTVTKDELLSLSEDRGKEIIEDIYSAVPGAGRICVTAQVDPLTWSQMAAVQKDIHDKLHFCGLRLVAPQPGQNFHEERHRQAPNGVVYVKEDQDHLTDKIESLVTPGLEVDGDNPRVLLQAVVRRYVCL